MATYSVEQQQEIISRIRQLMALLNLSQNKFGARLGISAANMSKHLSGRLPITPGLVNRICLDMGVSRQWLTQGLDVPFGKNEGIPDLELQGMERLKSLKRGVPVYDIDVTAGFGSLEKLFTENRVTGYVDLPQFANSDTERIVRVSGHSMEPAIANGSYIAIREVQTDTIYWGQTYVVILEDYRMVKVVRKNADPKQVTLHSENPDYDDLEVARSNIMGMYLVDAVLNFIAK